MRRAGTASGAGNTWRDNEHAILVRQILRSRSIWRDRKDSKHMSKMLGGDCELVNLFFPFFLYVRIGFFVFTARTESGIRLVLRWNLSAFLYPVINGTRVVYRYFSMVEETARDFSVRCSALLRRARRRSGFDTGRIDGCVTAVQPNYHEIKKER